MKIRHILAVCALLLVGSAAFAQNHARGQLKVGAAKVDVTPAPDQLGRNSYGILDRTNFRVILFSNGTTIAGLANVDGNANQRCVDAVNERIQKEFGIPAGNIIYNGTHCHSTGTVPQDEMTERMYQAIKKAYENMVPAKVGVGEGVCYLNVKRDLFDPERGTWWEGPDYDGKSDKTVSVARKWPSWSPVSSSNTSLPEIQPPSPGNAIFNFTSSPMDVMVITLLTPLEFFIMYRLYILKP